LKGEGLYLGDVLALQLSSSLEFILLTLGALSQGIAVLPLNPTYRDEVEFFLEDAQAKLFISEYTDAQHVSSARVLSLNEVLLTGVARPIEVVDDSLAFLLYTSGTTGKPKGAYITHSNLLATVTALHDSWEWTAQDRMLHVLPLFHVHGLFVGLLTAFYAGATVELEGTFQVESVLSKIAQGETTVFMGVPTIYYRILSFLDGRRCSTGNVRLFTCGSAPLPTTLHRAFEHSFSQRILERYGMTEVGIVLSNPYNGERKIGSVGFPIGDTKVEVRDEQGNALTKGEVGELWHCGSSVISKYLNRPQQSAETIQNGWLRSGDLGYQDEEGYFYIVGRAKDMIISGGLNIYPREIEASLQSILKLKQ
jgi:malonyl-CoA/methylmalonyl-CoA synthetase